MDGAPVVTSGKCPVLHGSTGSSRNQQWWPNQLNLTTLNKHADDAPSALDYDYAEAFKSLDLDALRQDIFALMKTSQDWWPADYGHYGPFFIRMAWHSSGTYRVGDGRGGAGSGTLRFAPLNSWPDNANLEKARLLLWPIKQKYGRKISWADLMIFTGNCALESMGFETFGFCGGRVDRLEPEDDINWGPETDWLGDKRYSGDRELSGLLGAVQMGLIYVNPEGPNGMPDPLASARDIRETFGRMAMNDEETVALIAGGHTFGKAHGAANPDDYIGREPEAGALEDQSTGWKSSFETGSGRHAITSGLEGAWTATPTQWDNSYFDTLFGHDWVQTQSPAGATQWIPANGADADTVPDAHDPMIKHAPIMFTSDLALKEDPAYAEISRRFHANPAEFADAFAKAWFKLTHRDMGPYVRGLGPLKPAEPQLWQDPVPDVDHALIDGSDITSLKAKLLDCGLSISQLVTTAWASAATYRGTDMRGGANGARIRLAPQKDWAVNNPADLAKALTQLEAVQQGFNDAQTGDKKVSLADIIVLGGCAAIEKAAKNAGQSVTVPFSPGRMDASQAMTDVESVDALEPTADGFRNYMGPGHVSEPAQLLIDKANLMTLSAPEMTVLLGGLRSLNINADGSDHGVFTRAIDTLSNDFFTNLLDMTTAWTKSDVNGIYEGRARGTDDLRWTATAVDLVFGSNTQLRAIAEIYASSDAKSAFVADFVKAWAKVMDADRFELA